MGSFQEGLGLGYGYNKSSDAIAGGQSGYLYDLWRNASNAAAQNTVAPFDPLQLQAQQQAIGTAGQLQPFVGSALGGNQFLSSGAVLSPQNNPFLAQYAQGAIRPVFENLTRNVLPGIRDEAALTGNVGGSRQGIAEGLATQGALSTAGDITSGLYNQAYGQGLNAMIQGLGLAPQTANLGLLPANILESVGGARQVQQQRQLENPLQNLSILAQILGDPTILNQASGQNYSMDRNIGGSFLSGM